MSDINVTPEQQRKYKGNPNVCPFCGSDDITAGHFDASHDAAYRDVQCLNLLCQMTWTEHFLLSHIDEVSKRED